MKKVSSKTSYKSAKLFINVKAFGRNSLLLVLLMQGFSCAKRETKTIPPVLPHASAQVEATIRKAFPGAMASAEFGDSLLNYLNQKYHIAPDKMLLGVSTCVDDIIYTKNFHHHPEIKGPFHLGGLAGLPFTGISGLEAFAHHIPDSGTMVLLVEPHIGYSEKSGWGYVLRHEQLEASSCCGALMGTLKKLQNGALKDSITEDDYQGGKIGELAIRHEKEILAAENPIIELTRVTSASAEKQIRAHVLDVDLKHVKYIIIITGVIINTDYMISDYQYVDHMMIYDVSKRTFVEDIGNTKKAF
jgi:Limiting CO2-inducible proteins B/C beta carbonyic anhydrases